MPNVSFDEEPQYRVQSYGTQKTGLTGLVIKYGFAATQKQAEYVLLGVAIAAVIFIALLFLFLAPKGSTSLTPSDIQRIKGYQQQSGIMAP